MLWTIRRHVERELEARSLALRGALRSTRLERFIRRHPHLSFRFPPASPLPALTLSLHALSLRILCLRDSHHSLYQNYFRSTLPPINMRVASVIVSFVALASALSIDVEKRAPAKVYRSCTKPKEIAITFDDGKCILALPERSPSRPFLPREQTLFHSNIQQWSLTRRIIAPSWVLQSREDWH